MQTITTRAEAKALGLKRYFTGKPCSHGHIAERRLSGTCLECVRLKSTTAEEKARHCRKVKAAYARNPEQMRARKYAWRNANREKEELTRRKSRGQPTSYPRRCPNACECCGESPTVTRKLCLDHDHKTGVFRGWLCHSCNTAIGSLGDSEAGVMRAVIYLRAVSIS